MINIQQQAFNQALGSQYVSNSFTLPISVPTSVSITGGTLNVNNIDVVSPATVNPSDTLIVKITNSGSIATTSYATVSFDTTEYIFASTTITDPIHYHQTSSHNIGPFDFVTYPNGYTVPLYSGNNKISKISVTNSVTYIPTSSYTLTTDSYPPDASISLKFIANYSQDSIYLVNDQSVIVGRISLPAGSNPSYLIDYPIQQYIAVSLSGSNQVILIDKTTGTIVHTLSVGTRPMGIAVDVSNNIWVANYASNNVSIISNDFLTVTNVAVGNGPLDLTMDANGNIWVSNSLDNTVSVIDANTHAVTTINVGNNPWGVCKVNNYIYVSNSYSDTISKIDITTNTVISTLTLANNTVPYSMVSTVAGVLYVSCFDSATIIKIVNDVIVDTISVEKYPFGLSVDNQGNLWMANFYSNLPTRTYLKNQTPTGFSFLDIRYAYRSTTYTTNTITVAGLDEVTPASIPPIANTHLIKNTVNVGYSTTVTNGDVLSIQVTTSNTYSDVLHTELIIGNFAAPYTVTNEPYNPYVDDYRFTSITNATTSTLYTSNEVTISGMSSDVSANVSITSGNLLKNNISVGTSTTVVDGDKLKIELTSSASANTPVQTTISIGTITDIFSVTTAGTSGFKATPTYNLGVLTGQPLNTLVSSNTITITNLLDDGAIPIPNPFPITITVDPYPGAVILVNSISQGQSATVTNGDTVQLQGYSPLYDGHSRTINLYMGPHVFPWVIRTLIDLIPLPFIFQDLYEAVPGSTITSNMARVDGMTPGYPINVFIPYGTLLVNGNPSTTIQNGDQVQIQLTAKPPFHGTRNYQISAGGSSLTTGVVSSWYVHTTSLTYPVHYESTNLQPIPLIPTFTETRKHGVVQSVNTQFTLTQTNHAIPASTKPTLLNLASKKVTKAVPPTQLLNSVHHSIRSVTPNIMLSHAGIIKSFTDAPTIIQLSKKVSYEVGTHFVHGLTHNTTTISPSFIKTGSKPIHSVPIVYQLSKKVTHSIGPTVVPSHKKSVTFVMTPVHLHDTVSHTIGIVYVKSHKQSHIVGEQYSVSHDKSHTFTTSPVLSHKHNKVISLPVTKGRSSSYEFSLTPNLYHKQSIHIPLTFTKSVSTSHYITSVGPIVGDSWTYENVSAPHYGTFASSTAAHNAGIAAGYSAVSTIKLIDGSYIWIVSASDCLLVPPPPPPPPPGTQPPTTNTIAFGYQQGG